MPHYLLTNTKVCQSPLCFGQNADNVREYALFLGLNFWRAAYTTQHSAATNLQDSHRIVMLIFLLRSNIIIIIILIRVLCFLFFLEL